MIINYSDFDYLPERLKSIPKVIDFLETGIALLELLNDRFLTPRNVKDLKQILDNHFDVELKKLVPIKIHVGEHQTIFVNYSLFKIRVYVDLD